MTPIERAERAKELLANPALMGVFRDLRAELVDRLERCPIGDVDIQHEITLMLQLLKRIQTTLETYTEEIAVDQLKQRHESFIERARETIHDLMPRRIR